jgi:excisionase family DNA binding protein
MPPIEKSLPDALISLSEAAALYGFDQDYLRQLVHRQRLRAKKVGRDWLTTRQDMEDYIASRKKTGVYRGDIKP